MIDHLNWKVLSWRVAGRRVVEMERVTFHLVVNGFALGDAIVGVAIRAGARVTVGRDCQHVIVTRDPTHLTFEVDSLSIWQFKLRDDVFGRKVGHATTRQRHNRYGQEEKTSNFIIS